MSQTNPLDVFLKEIKEIYENSSIYRNVLITSYSLLGRKEEAKALIDDAISKGNNEWFLSQQKGEMLKSKNMLKDAII